MGVMVREASRRRGRSRCQNPRMKGSFRPPRWASWTPWVLSALVVAGTGALWLARHELAQRRDRFDTDARIAHRLLSQRAVEHDAILATLALLQPAAAAAPSEARLPAVYPQVLGVARRERGAAWADPALNAAEEVSRRAQRAALAAADLSRGSFTLVRAAEPASFALAIDIERMVPAAEWPLRRGGPVQARLEHNGRAHLIAAGALAGAAAGSGKAATSGTATSAMTGAATAAKAGATPDATGAATGAEAATGTATAAEKAAAKAAATGAAAGATVADRGSGLWHFEFRKRLAAESQPFDVVITQSLGLAALPWAAMLLWAGAVAGVVATGAVAWRQRSERQRAEELLRLGQVSRLNALGELAAGMAHELNQPLTALLASTQAALRMLADEPTALAPARDAMTHAVSQARRASDVLKRLRRAVERPELGAAQPTVPLVDAVRNVLYLLEPECKRRGVAPLFSADDAVKVGADPVALEQIVHNLLMNALQALEQVPAAERTLELTVSRVKAGAQLVVRDSGPGLAPEDLPHLFEPFFSRREGGMGLGLSLCESLASGLGGSLKARQNEPRGAEFTLVLPQAAA